MMMLLRYKNFILISLSAFFLCCCTSSPDLYTLPAADGGQLLFIRPTETKITDFAVQKISFDMTISVADSVISENPVFNYSLELDKTDIPVAENIEIKLIADKSYIPVADKILLFKKPSGKKFIIRYSVSFSKEDIYGILDSRKPVQIQLEYDGKTVVLDKIDSFNSQLDDVRLILL